MNQQSKALTLGRLATLTAGFAAVVASLAILTSVTLLFQSRGMPLQTLAAAERACLDKAYLSEREACMQRWATESQFTTVAVR